MLAHALRCEQLGVLRGRLWLGGRGLQPRVDSAPGTGRPGRWGSLCTAAGGSGCPGVGQALPRGPSQPGVTWDVRVGGGHVGLSGHSLGAPVPGEQPASRGCRGLGETPPAEQIHPEVRGIVPPPHAPVERWGVCWGERGQGCSSSGRALSAGLGRAGPVSVDGGSCTGLDCPFPVAAGGQGGCPLGHRLSPAWGVLSP